MKTILTTLFFATLVGFTSCSDPGEPYMPAFTGNASELFIVVEDNFWDAEVGQALRQEFTTPVEGLATAESNFVLFNYDRNAFGSLLQQHRNILIVDIAGSKDHVEPRINVKRDVWSKGQLVFEIKALDAENFIKVFKDNAEKITDRILDEDRIREQAKLRKSKNLTASKEVSEHFDIDFIVPKGYDVVKRESNFYWLRNNQQRFLRGETNGHTGYHDINRNIFIYTYPYLDSMTFSRPWQVGMRDSMLKTYVPGPTEGSYMATEVKHVKPIGKETVINDAYAFQLSGLWKVEGDFMGGAFIAYTIFDEKNNRVITIEGNVFAPNFGKRDFIRDLAATISMLKVKE